MLKRLRRKKLILMAGDFLLIITAFYLSYAIRYGEFVNVIYHGSGGLALSLLTFLFLFYIAEVYSFEGKLYRFRYLVKLIIAIVIANTLIAFVLYFFDPFRGSRIVFILNYFIIFSLLFLWRYFFELFFKYSKVQSRVFIVGAGKAGKEVYEDLCKFEYFKVMGFLDDDEKKKGLIIGSAKVVGDTSMLASLAENDSVDTVVVAITHSSSPILLTRIMNIKFNGVDTYDMPTFYGHIAGKVPILHINDSWLGYADFYGIRKNVYNTKVKMVIDKVLSVFGIIVFLPLAVVVAIAIKATSRGPVFFSQERVSINAKTFKIVKFRTMECGQEKERNLAGSKVDPRITDVGRILRFFRIDEIPQLWNVLKGDMSIIGPRSLIKEEVEEFTSKVPYFFLRHSIRPGITGWAQVNYKHGVCVEDSIEKLQYDLFYIKNLSLALDFHIFLKTVKAVLFGRGAR
ncbi:MAG: sugar transferase [Candidatus Scalindua sp.]|jgi:exopolysaccharide biosynthesis polyprenyl glycosylphosphotransferase|nr:sugar transferase [Candidatus Scalindua sp.]MBT6047027.1 sugar transferase [Candidatus Scalindua sp.]MBT6227434.1 sugar transferase [Candidatus Scalindua sp.]MBT7211966.1 sugar transferase [Candidatus Scalindua sp.]MBT7590744.1 sugar transferase [Candidatus Scalindua sp.]